MALRRGSDRKLADREAAAQPSRRITLQVSAALSSGDSRSAALLQVVLSCLGCDRAISLPFRRSTWRSNFSTTASTAARASVASA